MDYAQLATTVEVGGMVLLDDGLVALRVTAVDPASRTVRAVAENGGPIKRNKGVNLPGAKILLPALTDKVAAGRDGGGGAFARVGRVGSLKGLEAVTRLGGRQAWVV